MGYAAGTLALAKCSFGTITTPLTFLPTSMALTPMGPIGSCIDFVPFLNVKPFGLCNTLSNPMTAALTATQKALLMIVDPTIIFPAPCIPVPVGPWIPTTPSMGLMGPLLTQKSCLMCAWGGCIKITMPAQFWLEA